MESGKVSSLISHRSITLGVLVLVAIACAVAIGDYVYFERACDRVVTVTCELGGQPYSIGGWPVGRECVLRFDRLLTADDLSRLIAATRGSRRIYLNVVFSCNIPDDHLAAIRKNVASHHIAIMTNGAKSESCTRKVPTEKLDD